MSGAWFDQSVRRDAVVAGESASAVARDLGCCRGSVSLWCQEAGVELVDGRRGGTVQCDQARRAKVVQAVLAGATLTRAGAAAGVSRDSARRYRHDQAMQSAVTASRRSSRRRPGSAWPAPRPGGSTPIPPCAPRWWPCSRTGPAPARSARACAGPTPTTSPCACLMSRSTRPSTSRAPGACASSCGWTRPCAQDAPGACPAHHWPAWHVGPTAPGSREPRSVCARPKPLTGPYRATGRATWSSVPAGAAP